MPLNEQVLHARRTALEDPLALDTIRSSPSLQERLRSKNALKAAKEIAANLARENKAKSKLLAVETKKQDKAKKQLEEAAEKKKSISKKAAVAINAVIMQPLALLKCKTIELGASDKADKFKYLLQVGQALERELEGMSKQATSAIGDPNLELETDLSTAKSRSNEAKSQAKAIEEATMPYVHAYGGDDRPCAKWPCP